MKAKSIEYVVSAVVGAFFSFFGILAIPLALLIPCNIIDYFTGLAASKVNGQKITSDKSFIGIVKKVMMYILIFVGFGIDRMISYVAVTLHIEMKFPLLFAAMIASWLVIDELISITENCEATGVVIPILSPILRFIKKKIEVAVDIPEDESSTKPYEK